VTELNKHYPFSDVIDEKQFELEFRNEISTFTILLYSGSQVNKDAGIINGIAIIKGNNVVIDNIGKDKSHKITTEQKRLFYLASQIDSINCLHQFIFDYGESERYRGNLD
jgi:hypothetical protein